MSDVIDLANKRFVIIGLQGSGKTVLAKSILSSNERHIVYDPLGEYRGFRRYIPEDRHSVEELDKFIERVVIPYQPDLFLLDEMPRYVYPKPNRLPIHLADLVDLSRHWGIAWGGIARRPSQLHTDVIELAHYLFIFGLHGKNDRLTLNAWKEGLGDVVSGLEKHHFAILEEGRTLTVHSPVDMIE